jgi:hypothetical protein
MYRQNKTKDSQLDQIYAGIQISNTIRITSPREYSAKLPGAIE